MTLAEVISQVNEEKPNSFDEQKLTEYINQVEADLADFLGGSIAAGYEPYVYEKDSEEELIAPAPYDVLYKSYLKAQIDYALEEYQSYSNNQAQFMSDFIDYKAFAIRTGKEKHALPKRVNRWW